MFGSAVLELAVGLCVVFLVFSTVCSGIREFAARLFSEREKMLSRGIYRLLGSTPPGSATKSGDPGPAAPGPFDPSAHGGRIQPQLAALVLGHPLITNLAMKADSLPSYIPARTFALALLDVLVPGEKGPRTVATVRHVVESMGSAPVRNALLPIIDVAGDDMHKLQVCIERRFDDAMDRVSGWYKRHSQVLLFFIALGVAGAFNVDSLHISRALWTEPTLRAQIAREGASAAQAQPAPTDGTGSAPAADARALSEHVAQEAPMPIGWEFVSSEGKGGEGDAVSWVWRIIGWLITAFALSLGAPFWFDLLSQLVNLRSAGPPPLKEQSVPESIASIASSASSASSAIK